MNPNKQVIRQLHQENRNWPRELKAVPQTLWPDITFLKLKPFVVWRSSTFLVQGFNDGNSIRLSVNRTMVDKQGKYLQDISWDDLQRLKREAGYADRIAVEIYPPDRDIVNVANMRHLWIPNDGFLPQYWRAK